MATICYASIKTIVGKSADLELLVLRDNWLVTSRKLNLRLGDNFLLIMKARAHKTMLSKRTAKLVIDASTASFSKPYVVKSSLSWTITQIVLDAISAM